MDAVEYNFLTLSQVLGSVRDILAVEFPETLWMVAEIADFRKDHQRGHVYLELVEKKDDTVEAKARGTIWVSKARVIVSRFQQATGETLKAGMNILFAARVSFHQVHGFSLNVLEIDPVYTLGEMARKKREVLARLEREGILDLNRELLLPLVPKVIAVISSPEAAGFGDFCRHLDENGFGYRFLYRLFPARVQGEEAEQSIIGALERIETYRQHFDLAVIIRGGGSSIDLNCFNGYELARMVAHFPLPVLTGIGHERDETVLDRVAHTRLKTPTAVADFLIARAREFEDRLLQAQEALRRIPDRMLVQEIHRLRSQVNSFSAAAFRFLGSLGHRLTMDSLQFSKALRQYLRNQQESLPILWARLSQELRHQLAREGERLGKKEQEIRLLDPVHVLRRGYSLTVCRGELVRQAGQVNQGDELMTRFWKGTATSRVEEIHES